VAGKRGNGEGSISRRKDGLYMARYTVKMPDGTRKRKSIYGKEREEVAEKLVEALSNRNKGLVFDPSNQKLGDYLDRWLNDSVRGSVKPITFESYSRLVRVHIAPALGRMKLKALSPAHLQGFYPAKLDADLSADGPVPPRRLAPGSQAGPAVGHGAAQRRGSRGPAPRAPRRDKAPLPRPGEDATSGSQGRRLEALYVLAVHCGLRQGELLGLKWDDVDLERGILQVRRTLSGGAFTAPKTAKSRRTARLKESPWRPSGGTWSAN
jgi:integrase